MSANECVLFVGPTLYQSARPLTPPSSVRLLPPARRGDIAALIEAEPPGVLALVDGLFHSHLAAGHEELRDALQAGWQVWGLASMGAIRAYEMRHLGMRGFGLVHARFEAEQDFQDDEVALLHGPDPPYRSISEPLIHLRAALEDWEQRGLLPGKTCATITAHLKSLWYGDRTLRLFREMALEAATPDTRPRLADRIEGFDVYRLKTRDLERFFRAEPWQTKTENENGGK